MIPFPTFLWRPLLLLSALLCLNLNPAECSPFSLDSSPWLSSSSSSSPSSSAPSLPLPHQQPLPSAMLGSKFCRSFGTCRWFLSRQTSVSTQTAQHLLAETPTRSTIAANLRTRGGGGSGGSQSYSSNNRDDDKFKIVDEQIVYQNFRTILQRRIRMPKTGKIVNFDLVGVKNSEMAVLVFAWDTRTKTATMIREYMPGPNRVLWGIAAGLVEPSKHEDDARVAGEHELEEECHLIGGEWYLVSENCAMDKYATMNISVYLVVDPVQAVDPKPMDEEEDIEIVPGVTIEEIMLSLTRGEMNVVGGFGCLMAITKLRELGLYS